MVDSGGGGGGGGGGCTLLAASKSNLRLLYSSFGSVPISLQR